MPVLLTAAFNEVSNDKKQLRTLRPASNLTSTGKRNAKLADAMTHRELFVFARDLRPFNRAFRYRSCYLADRWLGVTLIHQSATWYRNMCPAATLPAVTAARSPASMGPYPSYSENMPKRKTLKMRILHFGQRQIGKDIASNSTSADLLASAERPRRLSNMMRFSIGNRLTFISLEKV